MKEQPKATPKTPSKEVLRRSILRKKEKSRERITVFLISIDSLDEANRSVASEGIKLRWPKLAGPIRVPVAYESDMIIEDVNRKCLLWKQEVEKLLGKKLERKEKKKEEKKEEKREEKEEKKGKKIGKQVEKMEETKEETKGEMELAVAGLESMRLCHGRRQAVLLKERLQRVAETMAWIERSLDEALARSEGKAK